MQHSLELITIVYDHISLHIQLYNSIRNIEAKAPCSMASNVRFPLLILFLFYINRRSRPFLNYPILKYNEKKTNSAAINKNLNDLYTGNFIRSTFQAFKLFFMLFSASIFLVFLLVVLP